MAGQTFERWRQAQLRNVKNARVLPLPPDKWALVLFPMKPSGTSEFLRTGRTKTLISAPIFVYAPVETEPTIALASAVAAWVEGHPEPHRLAPPILSNVGGWEVVDFGLDWPLPATEVVLRRAA
jgi:hypothetical protein